MTCHFFLLICLNFNLMIKNTQIIIIRKFFVNEKYSVLPASLSKRIVYKTHSKMIRLQIFKDYNTPPQFHKGNLPNKEKKGHKTN